MIHHIVTENISEISDEVIIDRTQREPWLFVALINRYENQFFIETNKIIFDDAESKEIVRETFQKIYTDVNLFKMHRYPTFFSWAHALLLSTVCEHRSAKHLHTQFALS